MIVQPLRWWDMVSPTPEEMVALIRAYQTLLGGYVATEAGAHESCPRDAVVYWAEATTWFS